METRLLLLTITYQQPCSILPHSHPLPLRNPSIYSSQNPNLSSRIRRIYTTRYRRWDANAETVRTRRFNFNFRNNDDDDDDENDDVSWEMDQGSGILEEFIDSAYIFKVFRSFGWMLPVIILSMLLATGPKAFLLALALTLGQSALSLAFKKLFGRTQKSPKRKSRTKKKPSANTASNVEREEEQEKSQGTRKGKTGYQSWVVGIDGSVKKGGQDAPNFGGWEELDKRRNYDMGSVRRRPGQTTGGSRRTPVEKGRLSMRERKRNTPLLLRLLIAVFPFLGSWTKLL